jgi:hypothetical protein
MSTNTKPKASEIYGKLAPTLGETEARAYCEEMIAKGTYENDLGTPPIISSDELAQILELVKGSTAFTPSEPKAALRSITKGGNRTQAQVVDTDVSPEVAELVAAFEVFSAQEDTRYTQIAKGITGIATINQKLLTTLVEMDRRNTAQAKVVEDLSKVVDSLAKGGPKSVQAGTVAAPHPGDLAAASARARAAENGEIAPGDDADSRLFDEVLHFTNTELAKGSITESRRSELVFGQATLLSGAHPREVAQMINYVKAA